MLLSCRKFTRNYWKNDHGEVEFSLGSSLLSRVLAMLSNPRVGVPMSVHPLNIRGLAMAHVFKDMFHA
jgi:hypothetical protein